jgi:hypothetical protein
MVTPDDRRYALGAVGKWWLPGAKIMLLAELDLQLQTFTSADARRVQLLAYAQATRMFLPGLMIGATLQRWTPDLALRASSRNAFELDVQLFPWAHTEAHLLTRVEANAGDTAHPDLLVLLQLHYFL